MLTKLGIVLCVLLFPFLCLQCIEDGSLAIASKIQQGVVASIGGGEIGGVGVRVDGRDITLMGKVPTEDMKAKAGDLAAGVWGVRSVTNELMVAGDAKAINTQISRILSDRKIEFETGTDVLLPASVLVLKDVLGELKKGPGLSIVVNGYTDDTGLAADNVALSERRARAVMAWFGKNGVQATRMQAAGFGSDHPIAPNTTPEGKAKNRRVEIITDMDAK